MSVTLRRAADLSVILWFVLIGCWLTWAPFDFGAALPHIRMLPDLSPVDLAGNMVLLAPFAVALAACVPQLSVRSIAILATLVSAAFETGQLFLGARVVSPADIILNASGALAAAAWLRRRPERRGRMISDVVFGSILVGVVGFTIYTSVVMRTGMRLVDWDGAFEITAEDEVDGARTYEGVVRDVELCAGAGTGRVCAAPGAARAERDTLVAAAERTQQFEARMTALSTSPRQEGPARLLTFSAGPYDRNMMVGQEGTALVIRIRTPLMGPNGRDFELWVPNAVPTNVPARIAVIYDHGDVRVRISADRERTASFRFDGLAHGIVLRGSGRVTPAQSTGSRTAGLVVLAWAALAVLLRAVAVLREAPVRDQSAAEPADASS